mmetsp:Transcript_44530/g.60389  ORF Transcript_44530/g.60389 Transcript_44530/m.60389 type:complete len:317 (-) Transcript_44530:355-1305(-)
MGIDTLGTDEKLGKILGLSVSDGPGAALGRIKHGFLVLLITFISLSFSLLFIVFFTFRFLDWLSWLLWLWEFFVLDLVLLNVVLVQVEGKADHRDDFTNSVLNTEHLVHVSKLKAFVFVLQFAVVAKTFKKNVLLVGSLLTNGLLDELHNKEQVIVDGGVLGFTKLILHIAVKVELFNLLGGQKFSTHISVIFNVLFNKLVNRQVDHVVLDGEVGASSVHRQFLFVINQDHLRGEVSVELSFSSLQRAVGTQIYEVYSVTVLCVGLLEGLVVLVSISLLLSKLFLDIFRHLFNFISLFITVFNTLVISFTVDNKVW